LFEYNGKRPPWLPKAVTFKAAVAAKLAKHGNAHPNGGLSQRPSNAKLQPPYTQPQPNGDQPQNPQPCRDAVAAWWEKRRLEKRNAAWAATREALAAAGYRENPMATKPEVVMSSPTQPQPDQPEKPHVIKAKQECKAAIFAASLPPRRREEASREPLRPPLANPQTLPSKVASPEAASASGSSTGSVPQTKKLPKQPDCPPPVLLNPKHVKPVSKKKPCSTGRVRPAPEAASPRPSKAPRPSTESDDEDEHILGGVWSDVEQKETTVRRKPYNAWGSAPSQDLGTEINYDPL